MSAQDGASGPSEPPKTGPDGRPLGPDGKPLPGPQQMQQVMAQRRMAQQQAQVVSLSKTFVSVQFPTQVLWRKIWTKLSNVFEWKVNSFSHLLTNSFEHHIAIWFFVNGCSHNNTLAKHFKVSYSSVFHNKGTWIWPYWQIHLLILLHEKCQQQRNQRTFELLE